MGSKLEHRCAPVHPRRLLAVKVGEACSNVFGHTPAKAAVENLLRARIALLRT